MSGSVLIRVPDLLLEAVRRTLAGEESAAARERRHQDDLADAEALLEEQRGAIRMLALVHAQELAALAFDFSASLDAVGAAADEAAERARVAEAAVEKLMDALVAFDARCARGDTTGAVRALRAGLARLRGSAAAPDGHPRRPAGLFCADSIQTARALRPEAPASGKRAAGGGSA